MSKRVWWLIIILIIVLGSFWYISSNTARNLDQYVAYLIYDPQLALPGVELDQFALSLQALELSQTRIAKTTQYPADIITSFSKVLYPIKWLETLSEVEAERRTLLAAPSEAQAKKYQRTLIRSMDAYIEHIDQLLEWYKDNPDVLTGTARSQTYFSGATSFEYALNTIKSYKTQMQQQKAKAVSRYDCFLGKRVCETVEIPAVWAVPEFYGDEFPPDVLTIVKAVREAGGGSYPFEYQVVRLTSPRCEFEGKGEYYHTWSKSYEELGTTFRIDPLADVIVRDLSHEAYQQSLYHQAYQLLGGTQYEIQSLGNYYVCPDVSYDLTKILSVLYVYTNISNQPELDPVAIEDELLRKQIEAVQFWQEQIRLSEVPDEHMASSYIEQVWLLLSEFSESDVRMVLGDDVVRQLQEELLTYRLGTYAINTLITSVANQNDAIISYDPYEEWNFINDITATRNVAPLLLGGSNPSIIPNRVSWVENQRENVASSYLSYQNDLRNTIALEEFVSLMVKGKQASDQLLQQTITDSRSSVGF